VFQFLIGRLQTLRLPRFTCLPSLTVSIPYR